MRLILLEASAAAGSLAAAAETACLLQAEAHATARMAPEMEAGTQSLLSAGFGLCTAEGAR